MPVSPDLKAALAPGHLVKNDTPAIATVLDGTFKSTIEFKPEDLGKISGTLNEQLAQKLFNGSYGELTNDQRYLIVTLEAILENHNVDPSKVHPGDTFSFDFLRGTYSVDRGGDGQNVKEGEMKVADRIQNLEGVAPERLAAEINSLEKDGLLVKALQHYKEDPSYNGRVAFIEAHKDVFVDLLNHYLPASSSDKFSADAPRFGYKPTDNVTQNIAYLKAYLNLKRHEQLGTPLAIEVAAPAAPTAAPEQIAPVEAPATDISPESVVREAPLMPNVPGASAAAPVEAPVPAQTVAPLESLTPDQRVDVLVSDVDQLSAELNQTTSVELVTPKGHEHLRDLRARATEMRKQHDALLPQVTDADGIKKLNRIDQKLRTAERYSVLMLFKGPKEKIAAPSLESIQNLENLTPDKQVDVLASVVKMLNAELLTTYGFEMFTKKGREHFQNLRTLTVEMRMWHDELVPKVTDAASTRKLRDINQDLRKAQGYIDMLFKGPKEKVEPVATPAARVETPVVAPTATSAPQQFADVDVPVPTTPLATDYNHVSDESKVRAVPLMPGAETQPEASDEDSLAAKKAGEALGINTPYQMDAEGLELDTNMYYSRSMEAPVDFAAQYDVPGEPHFLRVTYNRPEVDRDGRIRTTVEFKTTTGDVIRVPVETELPNRATIDAYQKAQRKAGRPLEFANVAARIAWERYDEALKTALKTVKPTVDADYAFWKSTLHAPAAEPTYTEDEVVAPPAGPAPTTGPIDFDFDDGYVAPTKAPEVLHGTQKVHLVNKATDGLSYNADHRLLTAAETAQIHAADAALQEGHVYDGELPVGPYMMNGDPFTVEKMDGVFTYKTAE